MNAATDHLDSYHIQRILEDSHTQTQYTASTTAASAVLLVLLGYQLFYWLDYPILSMSELLWNSAVHAAPSRAIFALERALIPKTTEEARHDAERSESNTHARKSQSMRRLLGLDGTGILSKIQRASGGNAANVFFPSKLNTTPPGLGNWDNSCYQNSVIQGLASLQSFSAFLNRSRSGEPSRSTKEALGDILEKLTDQANLGAMFWTPAQLKSMSSWQQQDAQEYFSKLMAEVERETVDSIRSDAKNVGLAAVQTLSQGSVDSSTARASTTDKSPAPSIRGSQALTQLPDELQSIIARNPLEGLLAQRVGCLKCGFVEGLSLVPFNCLTLPLGKQWLYDIRSCLDDYTSLEPINGVDCAKCTLLQSKTQLEKLRCQLSDATAQELQSSAPLVSEALRASVEERLHAVNEALDNDDFSDNTILKKCQVPQKSKVSSTKTRQAVIARAPKSLAIHINRSVFDEMTGMLSKNYADVRFPMRFSLRSWCLGGGDDIEQWNTNPAESVLPDDIDDGQETDKGAYELRAALTHYGRHENGHYVCYRRHETTSNDDTKESEVTDGRWWRFSDEDVSAVSEDNVLAQGDVFMLFYERVDDPPPPSESERSAVEKPMHGTADAGIDTKSEHDRGVDIEVSGRLTPPTTERRADEIDPVAKMSSEISSGVESAMQEHGKANSDMSEGGKGSPASELIPKLSILSAQVPVPAVDQTAPLDTPPADITTTIPPLKTTTVDSSPPPSSIDSEPTPSPRPKDPPRNNDSRNTAHSMRTATPRSGRGSVSRGKKGIGKVSSSMVTAN